MKFANFTPALERLRQACSTTGSESSAVRCRACRRRSRRPERRSPLREVANDAALGTSDRRRARDDRGARRRSTWAIFERGEAWLSARWTLPATVGATLGLPTSIPALAMGLVGLAAAGWVVWRMTLGGDHRVPRLALADARAAPRRPAWQAREAPRSPRRPARRGDLPLRPRPRAPAERPQGRERRGARDRHRHRARPLRARCAR